jgi:hypothetical protein
MIDIQAAYQALVEARKELDYQHSDGSLAAAGYDVDPHYETAVEDSTAELIEVLKTAGETEAHDALVAYTKAPVDNRYQEWVAFENAIKPLVA